MKKKKKFRPAPPPAKQGPYPEPYVVRFGPWARNLYIGVPAALAFALIGFVADMPWWGQVLWFGVVGLMTVICVLTTETRIHKGDRVVVLKRFAALVPYWQRTFPLSAFKSIRSYSMKYAMTGSTAIDAHTIYLELQNGDLIPVQSYSSGADNKPSPEDLRRALRMLTGLAEDRKE